VREEIASAALASGIGEPLRANPLARAADGRTGGPW
jgi:hypothetical protein